MPTVSIALKLVIEMLFLSCSRMSLCPAAVIVTLLIIVYTGLGYRLALIVSLMPTVSITLKLVIEMLVLSHSGMSLRPAAVIVTLLIIVYAGLGSGFALIVSFVPTVPVTIVMVIEILVLSRSRMSLRPAAVIVTFLIIVHTGARRRSRVRARRRWRHAACQIQRNKQSRSKCQ